MDDEIKPGADTNQNQVGKSIPANDDARRVVPVATFLDFEKMPLSAFAKKVQRKKVTWVFHHIPKTAGSSLVDELHYCFPPYFNIGAAAARQNSIVDRPDKLMGGVDELLELSASTMFGSVSGHMRPVHFRRVMENLPNAAAFTFLREPIARYVSEYRYVRTPKHPAYQEMRRKYQSIEDYVDDEATHDMMWRFVSGGKKLADPETIAAMMRRYVFIGTLEDYNLNFEFFTALTGHPKTPSSRMNVTEKADSNEVVMTDALKSRIAEANKFDIAIYDAVVACLNSRRQEMAEFVDERRSRYAGQMGSA